MESIVKSIRRRTYNTKLGLAYWEHNKKFSFLMTFSIYYPVSFSSIDSAKHAKISDQMPIFWHLIAVREKNGWHFLKKYRPLISDKTSYHKASRRLAETSPPDF